MPFKLESMSLDDLEKWTIRDLEMIGKPPDQETVIKIREDLLLCTVPAPEIRYFKVIDEASGEAIACAKWQIYPYECSEAGLDERVLEAKMMTPPFNDELVALIIDHRAIYMRTRPHLLLTNLKTHRERRDGNAAEMLIQQGVDRADRDGIEMYLETMEAMAPFYAKFGFKEVAEIVLKHDVDDVICVVKCMARDARPKTAVDPDTSIDSSISVD